MAKKQLTTGQRLAYMLRTAVVEAQAVERGVHPNMKLNMFEYGKWGSDGVCEACLGGVYAMLGRSRPPWIARAAAGATAEEVALNDMRHGLFVCAARQLGLVLANERVAEQAYALVSDDYNGGSGRASWTTYLLAADILEKA